MNSIFVISYFGEQFITKYSYFYGLSTYWYKKENQQKVYNTEKKKKKPQQNQKLNHKMDQDSYHFTALIDMSRLLYFGSRDKIYTCSISQYHTNTKMTLSSLYAFGK